MLGITPKLRNASKSFIIVGASATDTLASQNNGGTAVRLPCASIQIDSDPNLWDASNSDDMGYGRQARGIQMCTGSFDIYRRTVDSQDSVGSGGEYYVTLYEDGASLPYQGTIIIGKKSTKANIKGELVTSVTFGFQGVYNSPSYPTAIADAAAGTGQFAAGFVPSFVPASGGGNGTPRTGGIGAAAVATPEPPPASS